MKKLVKEILESLENDAFSFVRESREWREVFKLKQRKFGKQSNKTVEDKFKFIVRGLIAAFTYLKDRRAGNSTKELESIEDFISAHSLENHQKVFLEYIPDIFRICRTAGDFGDLHAFLSKYFTDPKCFQKYLMVSEPIMFSWDNWYDLVIHLNPFKAEKAIIKLFEEDGIDRFQGNLAEYDWRISFLADLIDFCKANNLSKAKKACIEALASEAIHQNWVVNELFQGERYGVLMDGDSEVFEKAYLKNAMDMLSRQPDYYDLEGLDLDFKNFTDSKNLREFLKEKELKVSRATCAEAKRLLDVNDFEELIRLFSSKDFNVIKKNALLLKIFYEVPDLILKACNNADNQVIGTEDLILMEEISEWKEVARQIKETRTAGSDFERNMFLWETYLLKSDKQCFVITKEIADRGFAGLNVTEKAKFLEIFLHEDYSSLLTSYFHFPSYYDEEWKKWTGITE